MVLAWHSSPVDSSLLMQRQTMDLQPWLFQWSLRNISPHSPQIIMDRKQGVIKLNNCLTLLIPSLYNYIKSYGGYDYVI